MSDTRRSAPSTDAALPDPVATETVEYNPPLDRLRAYSRHLERTTEFGSPAYVSDQRSRSADRTRNAVDDEFDAGDFAHVEDALAYVRENEVVCLDRRMGRHPEHSYVCRLYVPPEYGRIGLAFATLFEPVDGPVTDPDFVTVQLPDWAEIAVRILPDEGLTAVLGSDYTGEAKKSFLRLFMYRAKQAGGLGLHAGSKRVRIEDGGSMGDVGQLFLGLSATGKSTLTAHGLRLDSPESATMLQDDVCALLPDGTVAGSEGEGLYVKTIGLDPDEQPALYAAVTHPSAVLENVEVDRDGTVHFESDEHTANGRAVVRREHLSSADPEIDLPHVDQVFFITRNPAMPPIAKLSPAEAGAAFMLGESIETSAGDPDRAGEAVRVVGTNPFIVGSPGAEGNRFRELVASVGAECFLINTGYVGDPSVDIGVEETVAILRAVARDEIEWVDDEATGLSIPAAVPGVDIDAYAVDAHLPDCESAIADLRAERREYLAQFADLDETIRDAVY